MLFPASDLLLRLRQLQGPSVPRAETLQPDLPASRPALRMSSDLPQLAADSRYLPALKHKLPLYLYHG